MRFELVGPEAPPAVLEAARGLITEYAVLPHVAGRWMTIDADLAALPSPFVPPHGALVVVYLDDAAMACGAVRLLDAQTAEVKRMYVRPAARGRGLGEALVRTLLAHARALGAERARLDTAPELASAIALYRKLGFTPIPRYLPEQLDDAVCFERALPIA